MLTNYTYYRERIVQESNLLLRFAALPTELFGFWPKWESNPWPANYVSLLILHIRIQWSLHYGAIQKLSTMDAVQIEKRLLQHITVIYFKTTFCSFIIIEDAKVEWQCAVFLRSKKYFVFLWKYFGFWIFFELIFTQISLISQIGI